MKSIIRMNQLAGLITESQATKMLKILNEDSRSSILDYIEEYIGADENEFKNDSEDYSDEDGNVEFTIPFDEITRKPSSDAEILRNMLTQNKIAIVRDTLDKDGGDSYTLLKVRYRDLLNYINRQ